VHTVNYRENREQYCSDDAKHYEPVTGHGWAHTAKSQFATLRWKSRWTRRACVFVVVLGASSSSSSSSSSPFQNNSSANLSARVSATYNLIPTRVPATSARRGPAGRDELNSATATLGRGRVERWWRAGGRWMINYPKRTGSMCYFLIRSGKTRIGRRFFAVPRRDPKTDGPIICEEDTHCDQITHTHARARVNNIIPTLVYKSMSWKFLGVLYIYIYILYVYTLCGQKYII